jgi:hypothetical protein
VVYTQACARSTGVPVPADPAPFVEYPATPIDAARMALVNLIAGAPAVVLGQHIDERV